MGVVQRGVFASSIWLGFMMSDAHLLVAGPLLAIAVLGTLVVSELRRSVALPRWTARGREREPGLFPHQPASR